MAIKLVTDTSGDLSQEIIQKYDIGIIPLHVIEGDKEYVDGVDIQPKEIYDYMRQGRNFKTAQISAFAMHECFEKLAKDGHTVLFLPLSKGISGTYESALSVAKEVNKKHPEANIIVIDTIGTSGGLGNLALSTAKDIKAGKSLDEILDRLKFNCYHMQYLFTVDDIGYLHRGGRISGVAKVLGSLLNIKPILNVDNLGKLAPLTKVRGKAKSYAKMIEIMRERMHDSSYWQDCDIFISHSDSLDDANRFKEMIEKELGAKNFYINMLSATVGVHTGPGLMSVYFLDKKYEKMGDGANVERDKIRK